MMFHLEYQPGKCPVCDSEPIERSEEPYREWVLFRCGAKWGADYDAWSGADVWIPYGQPHMCNSAQVIAYRLRRGELFDPNRPMFKQV